IDAPASFSLQASYSDGNGGLTQRSFKLNVVSTLQVLPSEATDTMQQASTGNDTYLAPRQISFEGNTNVTVSITYDKTYGSMATGSIDGIDSSLLETGSYGIWQVSGPKD